MLISLIRHGEVNGRAQVLRGRSDDALSQHGEQQMHDMVATLHTDMTAIACSPLQRCRTFAEELSQQSKLPLHIIDELREINFGEWENLTLAEAEARDPDCYHLFKHQTELWQPPGGEPYAVFRQRIREALLQIRNINTSHLLVVTHGGVIRALIAECLQLSPASAARIGIPLAGLCQLWIDEHSSSLLRLHWLNQSC